jgi:histidyl-tRNA synthetase
MSFSSPPGVFDILPEASERWQDSAIWNYVEKLIREIAQQYGYKEIRTPNFERTELFLRGVGETTDIVSKEMYTFIDKGERSMTLRPEGTAPVIRSFIENKLYQEMPVQKLFYIGPMFRYERSQAGRYRQHHQFGVEAVGNKSPEQDVEVIDLLYTLYQRLGLKNVELHLNSIGDQEARLNFRNALKAYLQPHLHELSTDSQKRFEHNPLRILDSKDPQDQKVLVNAPSILDFLNEESRAHFERVKKGLDLLQISFVINPLLVRGLDYYNETVFEIKTSELGAQNSIGGGGRYDGLIKTLGGPDLPAMGFGTGIERIIQTMLKQNVSLPESPHPTIFLIPLGEKAQDACLCLLHQLRAFQIPSEMDLSGKKLNKVMQYANRINARYVAVIGDNELESNEIELKEMATGGKIKAPLKLLPRIIQLEIQEREFITLWDKMIKPFENPSEAQFFIEKIDQMIDQTQKVSSSLKGAIEKIQGIL